MEIFVCSLKMDLCVMDLCVFSIYNELLVIIGTSNTILYFLPFETSLIVFVKEKVPQIQYILYILPFLNNEFRPLFIMSECLVVIMKLP